MADDERRAHAILDRQSRLQKAAKIIQIIGNARFQQASDLLEVGCGSGVISSALSKARNGELKVHAVDVVDGRIEQEGYTFQLVTDTRLPYDDASFDVVISNHVIEHVGDAHAQLMHLMELRRVLRPDGVIYLAVPNRYRLVEPHYRLPFLSWFPWSLSDIYVRLSKRGTRYDCRPLSAKVAHQMFASCNLTVQDATAAALRATLSIEHRQRPTVQALARHFPEFMANSLMPVIPTFVYLLRKKRVQSDQ